MEIYFLRHASAGEPKLNPAKDDQRPLDQLGIEQSHSVGRALKALKVTVDAIITSPLVRARQTAEIVAGEIGQKNSLINDDALRPEATYDKFDLLLARYRGKGAIMVVGHNPSMTEFLNQLVTDGGSPTGIEFKKGAVARVDKNDGKSAMLRWSMPPKVVRAIQQDSASKSRPKTVSK